MASFHWVRDGFCLPSNYKNYSRSYSACQFQITVGTQSNIQSERWEQNIEDNKKIDPSSALLAIIQAHGNSLISYLICHKWMHLCTFQVDLTSSYLGKHIVFPHGVLIFVAAAVMQHTVILAFFNKQKIEKHYLPYKRGDI